MSKWNFSIQFNSVAQPCLTHCDPMDCSRPGLPVRHHLPEFTQTHPSSSLPGQQQLEHALSTEEKPSPPHFCQHQGTLGALLEALEQQSARLLTLCVICRPASLASSGICQKCRASGPVQDLLSWSLHFNQIPMVISHVRVGEALTYSIILMPGCITDARVAPPESDSLAWVHLGMSRCPEDL